MKQIRRHDRNLCAALLKIRWKDDAGATHRDVASLEDISRGGACLQVENPIPEETVLWIIHPKGKYQGRVKYCNFQVTGYFLGIEFEPGYHWSGRDYNPPHLLRFRLRNETKG